MVINTEQLRNLLGTEEAAQRFVTLFQQQLPIQLETLRQAFATKDWDTLSNTAHGLKSQCRYLGLGEAADLLQVMELNAAETDADRLEAVFALLALP